MRARIGPVVTEDDLPDILSGHDTIITVGDMVTATCLRLGFRPHLVVIDGRTRRGEHPEVVLDSYEILWVTNPPATITPDLWDLVIAGIEQGDVAIFVVGEEDLASLPAILYAPLGAVVLYGVPDEGVATVVVGPEEKRRVEGVLRHFEPL
ncbi:MAG TPA: DUF359 domain-containing protein [Thermoplasmata archaeon]|nr:DUF359 domain-containing protein [Thermoplasmata archaeon]